MQIVLTRRYATETKLTSATVSNATFGRLADVALDGQVSHFELRAIFAAPPLPGHLFALPPATMRRPCVLWSAYVQTKVHPLVL